MAQFLYKTVKPAGGDYTTLEACMNANEQDLTGDGWFDVEIDSDWSGGADTTAVVIHNYTTTAVDYINIYTTATARHKGLWSTDYYILDVSGNGMNISDNYITIDGLQAKATSTAQYQGTIFTSGSSTCNIKNNIIQMVAGHSFVYGIDVIQSYTWKIWNNIIYGIGSTNTAGIRANNGWSAVHRAYNNTIYGCTCGIRQDGGQSMELIATNNLCYNNTTDFIGTFEATSDYNFSKDDTAPEAAGNSIWGDTDGKTPDFVSVAGGSEDFHLQSTSDAINEGVDLGDTYDIDIDGNSRDATAPWDIGAAEYVSEGVAYPVSYLRKDVISGYHCFMNQYLKANVLGLLPLKLPDGTTW